MPASGRARAGAFKQAALGGEIVLHGVVKIEMVAGEIGEDGRGEAAAPQAIERQRVRAGFEHRVRAAFAHDFGEESACRSRDSGVVVVAGCVASGVRYSMVPNKPLLQARGAHDGIEQESSWWFCRWCR